MARRFNGGPSTLVTAIKKVVPKGYHVRTSTGSTRGGIQVNRPPDFDHIEWAQLSRKLRKRFPNVVFYGLAPEEFAAYWLDQQARDEAALARHEEEVYGRAERSHRNPNNPASAAQNRRKLQAIRQYLKSQGLTEGTQDEPLSHYSTTDWAVYEGYSGRKMYGAKSPLAIEIFGGGFRPGSKVGKYLAKRGMVADSLGMGWIYYIETTPWEKGNPKRTQASVAGERFVAKKYSLTAKQAELLALRPDLEPKIEGFARRQGVSIQSPIVQGFIRDLLRQEYPAFTLLIRNPTEAECNARVQQARTGKRKRYQEPTWTSPEDFPALPKGARVNPFAHRANPKGSIGKTFWLKNTFFEDEAQDDGIAFRPMDANRVAVWSTYMNPDYGSPPEVMSTQQARDLWKKLTGQSAYDLQSWVPSPFPKRWHGPYS